MEDVLRVIFVFERGQPRQLIRRIRASHPFGAFIAERIDVLASGERIESRRRTPRERDSSVILRRIVPLARGDVFEGGVAEGERGVLIGYLGDRAAVRLQADAWETSGRCVCPALQQGLNRIVG